VQLSSSFGMSSYLHIAYW